MGERDFHPLSANFLLSEHLKSHWSNYVKGKAEVGARRDVADWRVARAIFVPTTTRWRRATVPRRCQEPVPVLLLEQMRAKMKRGKRLYVFKVHKEQPDDEITP